MNTYLRLFNKYEPSNPRRGANNTQLLFDRLYAGERQDNKLWMSNVTAPMTPKRRNIANCNWIDVIGHALRCHVATKLHHVN